MNKLLCILLAVALTGCFRLKDKRNVLKLETFETNTSSYRFSVSFISIGSGIDIKAKQQYMQTTMLNLYFVLLSTGIGLYMYEYTQLMTAFWGIFVYGITSIWILFNWFYLRPKQIKKQQSKLDEIIGKFEMLNEQLNEKE